MALQHDTLPYERRAQGFRRENDGSAFFLLQPSMEPFQMERCRARKGLLAGFLMVNRANQLQPTESSVEQMKRKL